MAAISSFIMSGLPYQLLPLMQRSPRIFPAETSNSVYAMSQLGHPFFFRVEYESTRRFFFVKKGSFVGGCNSRYLNIYISLM